MTLSSSPAHLAVSISERGTTSILLGLRLLLGSFWVAVRQRPSKVGGFLFGEGTGSLADLAGE